MNAIEIVQKYLYDNGYDGLANPEQDCGCPIHDLFMCQRALGDCVPGYKKMESDGDWLIYEGKNP
jgi:hypothetical protein